MRVLVAGAGGVIGRQLIPLLVSAGHDVAVMARSAERAAAARRTGAQVVVADALDRVAVSHALVEASPDAVVNMLTALPARISPRRLAKDCEATNRLRTEGARNLVSAARDTGVRRLVAQGLAYAYDPAGDGPATEETPFWPRPPAQFAPVLAALRELERRTRDAGGLVLRFGHLYGPGSAFAADGSFVRQVRAGRVPLVGGGTATFSFTHARDAATAVVAALDSRTTGALNVVDDEPARVSEWLPFLADVLGAARPRRVPAAVARPLLGGFGVAWMTELRGADNALAGAALGWRPRYASWRAGFTAELTGPPARV